MYKQFARIILLLLGAALLGCGAHVHHKVERGETLYSIGWRYGQDYRTVAKWNDISPPYVIHEGQWLRVAPPSGDDTDKQPGTDTPIKSPRPQNKPEASVAIRNKPAPAQRTTDTDAIENVREWQWPTKGKIINTFAKSHNGRKGINIRGAPGQPIYAAAAGEIVYSGNGLVGLGNLIIIKHNKTFLSAYAHNEELLVTEGQKVTRGQQIARMGSTGTDEVLLHFEIRRNGDPVDPLKYLAGASP